MSIDASATTDLAPDHKERCKELRDAAVNLRNELTAFRVTQPSDELASYLVQRAEIAVDHALACAQLALSGLAVPSAVVVRSLMEAFFGTYWASLSLENARRLRDAGLREAMRIMKLNLRAGNAIMRHRETDENQTASFLQEPKLSEAERLPRFDQLARDAGLRRVYESLYGLMSMFAHGAGAEFVSPTSRGEFIDAQLHAAKAMLKCYQEIIVNRICHGRALTAQEVAELLRVPL
jgi:hypothetical protein